MAYSETKRNGVKFYGVSLSTSVTNLNNSTARISWTATVTFGSWYDFGVRLNVKVAGTWRQGGDGYTTSVNQQAVKLTGYTDVSRKSADYGVRVEAYTESKTVGGYGGVGVTTSCADNVTVTKVPYLVPDAPTNLTLVSSTDTQQMLRVTLPPKDGMKEYSKINFYRHTDDGGTETIYSNTAIDNYSDNTTTAGHKYTYDTRVVGQGGTSAMSNVVTVFTSPTAISSLELTKTADKKAQLKLGTPPKWYDGYEFQVSADGGGTWSAATVDNNLLDSNPPAGTVSYRVRAYKENPKNGAGDTIYSPWTESNSITTICPPNAPTVPSGQQTYAADGDGKATVPITWKPNHPDGSAQTMAQIEITDAGGTTNTVTVSGSSSTYTPRIGVGTITYRVRTKGLHADYGAWSGYSTVTVAFGAQAWFSSPANDDDAITVLPYSVEWNATDDTGISYQKVELRDSSGVLIASDEPDTTERSWNITGYSTLVNGGSYTLTGYVRNGAGLTTTFTRTFTTEWQSPAEPDVMIEYTDDMCAIVSVNQPSDSYYVRDSALHGTIVDTEGGVELENVNTIEGESVRLSNFAPIESYDISRKNIDGTYTVLLTGAEVPSIVIDRLPPLNANYEYVITVYAESGTFSTFNIAAYFDSEGFEAFNFGDAAETCLRVGFDANASRSKKASGNTFHFALGKGTSPLPTFYSNDDIDIDGTHSYKLHSRELYDRAEQITDKPENSVCWFRNAFGRVARVYVSSWNFSYAADSYMLWTMGANLTEVVWEEPLR